jgi:methylamine dehydrogenase heavy chain
MHLVSRLLLIGCLASPALAEQAAEVLTRVELPERPGAHWVWVNDIAFFNMVDGRAYLVDADAGRVLGMISGGSFHDALAIPGNHRVFYTTDTYYSRGTRGERTDVVTIYDPRRLAPIGEVVIPAKQLLSVPTAVTNGLTDDDRFLLQYNFTPAQSLSVVDTHSRTFAGEIDTAGCAFVYPTGPRTVRMLCADASLLTLMLDDTGKAERKTRSRPMFDPDEDLVNEDAVRVGTRWYFVSYRGDVYAFDGSGSEPAFDAPWPLARGGEEASWRPGGYQLFAIHRGLGRMYVSMQQGGPGSHKNPGAEIWVFDLKSRSRVQRIAARAPVGSMQVSQDAAPLLYTVNMEEPTLQIYDARTGEHLRAVEQLGTTPTLIQTPPIASGD